MLGHIKATILIKVLALCVDVRCEIGERVYSIAAPRGRNQLPTELKLSHSMLSFIRQLKAFLFHVACK